METTQIRIGRKIKSLRALYGMSQEQLAERAHIPQEHISRYERGKWKAINPDHLIAIAEGLGVALDTLVRDATHGPAPNGTAPARPRRRAERSPHERRV